MSAVATLSAEPAPMEDADAVFVRDLRLPPRIILDVVLKASVDTTLPGWTGSLLHGALGHALRAVDDLRNFAESPSYAAWMLAPEHAGRAFPAGVRPAPALVIRPPRVAARQRRVGAGEALVFSVVAFRREPGAVAKLLEALARIGVRGLGSRRTAFTTASIRSGGLPLLAGSTLTDLPAVTRDDAAASLAHPPRLMTFAATTPLTLRREGTLLHEPELLDLVLAALRRLVSLKLSSYDASVLPHLGDLAERAAAPWRTQEASWQPFDSKRWSSRQQRKHEVAGVLGHARYEVTPSAAGHPDARLAPMLLQRASCVGLGKGTALGLGGTTAFCESNRE